MGLSDNRLPRNLRISHQSPTFNDHFDGVLVLQMPSIRGAYATSHNATIFGEIASSMNWKSLWTNQYIWMTESFEHC